MCRHFGKLIFTIAITCPLAGGQQTLPQKSNPGMLGEPQPASPGRSCHTFQWNSSPLKPVNLAAPKALKKLTNVRLPQEMRASSPYCNSNGKLRDRNQPR